MFFVFIFFILVGLGLDWLEVVLGLNLVFLRFFWGGSAFSLDFFHIRIVFGIHIGFGIFYKKLFWP